MEGKNITSHLKTITVMQFLLEEAKKDCLSEGWRKGYRGSNGKKPVLDRLTEVRRLALELGHRIKNEY